MASTTKLIVYNEALRELASSPLANISSPNVKLQELNGAFDHAVEYMLARRDWNFARRRAVLTGTADTSFPPYTYRYARPSDFLRKSWIKLDYSDEFQIEHAETGSSIYGFVASAVIEYISDHADNYDPANWPPHFTRCMALYLALVIGPKIARAGADDSRLLYQKLDVALADAGQYEDVVTINEEIPTGRLPVFRRAFDMIGQAYAGSLPRASHVDHLRWQMNNAWAHCVRYCLERGAWNFATKRALLTLGANASDLMPGEEFGGIIEGYVVDGYQGNAETAFDGYVFAGFTYGWYLPSDLRHKLWIKKQANSPYEVSHQIVRDAIFTTAEPCVLEYVAEDSWTIDPDHWPATFLEVVAAYIALNVTPELMIDEGGKGGMVKVNSVRNMLERNYERKLSEARNSDAIQQYAQELPLGGFARARLGAISGSALRRRLN